MADLLAGAESALACGLFDQSLRDAELLAAAGKELGYVLDGVVGTSGGRGLLPAWRCGRSAIVPGSALVFVFVGIVRTLGVSCGASPRRTAGGGRPHTSTRGSQLFQQRSGDFLQEA